MQFCCVRPKELPPEITNWIALVIKKKDGEEMDFLLLLWTLSFIYFLYINYPVKKSFWAVVVYSIVLNMVLYVVCTSNDNNNGEGCQDTKQDNEYDGVKVPKDQLARNFLSIKTEEMVVCFNK